MTLNALAESLKTKNGILSLITNASMPSRKSSGEKLTEKEIQAIVHQKVGGRTEVSTPVGRIDILTDTHIVELKKVDDWKHAVGQLAAYSSYYPAHKKALFLFGHNSSVNRHDVVNVCREQGIEPFYLYFSVDIKPLD